MHVIVIFLGEMGSNNFRKEVIDQDLWEISWKKLACYLQDT